MEFGKNILRGWSRLLLAKNLRLSAEYALVNDRTLSKHNYSLVNTELSIKF